VAVIVKDFLLWLDFFIGVKGSGINRKKDKDFIPQGEI
jgi:hypothetical protein